MKSRLKSKLRDGKTVLGTFLKLTDPAVVEIVAMAGFDFVVIDTEHGPISFETAQNLVRAAEAKEIDAVIRVTENKPGYILRALDIGASGIQVPQVYDKQAALKAVRAAKYHPLGERGVCRFVRAADYSLMDREEYFHKANERTIVIVHVEGQQGIENLNEILSVDNLDVIFLGPYDLSQSCGVPGKIDHPMVVEKMQWAVRRAKQANMAVGTFVDTIDNAAHWIKAGVQYITYSVDVGILASAAKEVTKSIQAIPRS